MAVNFVRASKFLSLVLRHHPEIIGIALDENGWADVDALLGAFSIHDLPMTFDELVSVVETNKKRRFAFDAERTHIRASQGHSVAVDLGYASVPPPPLLYHGTTERFLPAIRSEGLLSGKRRHVHLSVDRASATEVGARHGRPVVLTIDASAMHREGSAFFVSDNGIWLTEAVLPRYIVSWI